LIPDGAGLVVDDVLVAADRIDLTLRSTLTHATCPCCGSLSGRIHSRYRRSLADLPWAARRVRCAVQARRFRCPVPTCPRRIFTERLPALAAPYARRAARLARLLEVLGLVVGGRPAVRLARHLGLPISVPSLLRLVRRTAPTLCPAARCVGINDFALRRGQRYGSALVDLECHRPIDLLPERSTAATAAWFAGRPCVEVVSRDRAGVYAEGARTGAPQARQVADRWHLLHNLTDAFQRWSHATTARCARRLRLPGHTHRPPSPRRTRPCAPNRRGQRRQASHARRQAQFEEIRRLHAEGVSISAIAAQFGMGRQAVHRYLRGDGPPADGRGRRPSQVGAYDGYLRERWAAGEQNISSLWREIRTRGFTGGRSSVWDYVSPWRTTPGCQGPAARRPVASPSPPAPSRRMPSGRQATWWLLADPASLEPDQRTIAATLLRTVPAIRTAHTVMRDFGTILRERRGTDLEGWLRQAATCGVPELAGVAQSLQHDLPAVQAAIDSGYSNGQTEGQVTRIKLIKRQGYGRAKFDLLRLRVLYRDAPDDATP